MELAVETVVRLSGERARRLGQLAARCSTTEEALVAEALDLLFSHRTVSDEEVDDAELLRRMETEFGPLPLVHTVPLLNPNDIVSVVPVNLAPELMHLPGSEH